MPRRLLCRDKASQSIGGRGIYGSEQLVQCSDLGINFDLQRGELTRGTRGITGKVCCKLGKAIPLGLSQRREGFDSGEIGASGQSGEELSTPVGFQASGAE